MSRTRRRTPYRWFAKENTSFRRASVRKYKARCKQCIRDQRYDDIPLFKGTEGYLTW